MCWHTCCDVSAPDHYSQSHVVFHFTLSTRLVHTIIFAQAALLTMGRLSRVRALQLVAGAVVGGPLVGCEIYGRLPSTWRDLPPLRVELSSEVDELVVILPGAGGRDANTNRIATALASKSSAVHEYDWQPYVGDTLRAPRNAQRVGVHLAKELARICSTANSRMSVHLIGVSVGAFAADAAVETLKRASPGVHTKLTLLDPFTAMGLPGLANPSSAFGVDRFGRTADDAVCVLNTDDPVPSTNVPLRHCRNFDVTKAAARQRFALLPGDSMHSWPCGWFGLVDGTLPAQPLMSRGAVFQVP